MFMQVTLYTVLQWINAHQLLGRIPEFLGSPNTWAHNCLRRTQCLDGDDSAVCVPSFAKGLSIT